MADVGQGVGSVCITLWMVGELELCGFDGMLYSGWGLSRYLKKKCKDAWVPDTPPQLMANKRIQRSITLEHQFTHYI